MGDQDFKENILDSVKFQTKRERERKNDFI